MEVVLDKQVQPKQRTPIDIPQVTPHKHTPEVFQNQEIKSKASKRVNKLNDGLNNLVKEISMMKNGQKSKDLDNCSSLDRMSHSKSRVDRSTSRSVHNNRDLR